MSVWHDHYDPRDEAHVADSSSAYDDLDHCAGITRECRNTATHGAHCGFHASIVRAAERCMRGECRPSCTRGGCWRKITTTPTPTQEEKTI